MKSKSTIVVYGDWHMGMGNPLQSVEWFNEIVTDGRDYEIMLSPGDHWPKWRTVDASRLMYKQIRDERLLAAKFGPRVAFRASRAAGRGPGPATRKGRAASFRASPSRTTEPSNGPRRWSTSISQAPSTR